jgi:hypothetical protein
MSLTNPVPNKATFMIIASLRRRATCPAPNHAGERALTTTVSAV